MKTLFKVTCCGRSFLSVNRNDKIYVVANSIQEASDKALSTMVEKEYDKCDDYVESVKLIADENESNKSLLIL